MDRIVRAFRLWTFQKIVYVVVATFRIPRSVGHSAPCVDPRCAVRTPRRPSTSTTRTTTSADARTMTSSSPRIAPAARERASWPKYTAEDVAKHASISDGWIVVYERVYDITAFARTHPGFHNAGQVSTAIAIARALGSDATEEFEAIHSAKAWTQLKDFQIGVLARETDDADASVEDAEDVGDAREARDAPVPEWLSKDRDFWVKYAGGVSETTLAYLERSGCPQGAARTEAEVVAEVVVSGDGTAREGAKTREGDDGGASGAHHAMRRVGKVAALVAGAVVANRAIRRT